MNDEPQNIRQWRMLRMMSARRYGIVVSETAREFRVSAKTIRRDLQKLKLAGFPIDETTGERGCKIWRLADHAVVPPLAFTFDEAIVFHLARPLLEPLCGTQLWEAAHSALRKIKATLSVQALAYLERFPRFFHCTTHGYSDYTEKAEIIDTLTIAAEDRKAVMMTYQSQHATEPVTRDVYPYGLTRHKGSIYLVAFAVEHEQIRHYKVNRIEAAESIPFVFQRPDDFNIEAHLADSFGIFGGDEDFTVVVRFHPTVARYVQESIWHASQLMTPQRDGGVLARFQLSSTIEIKSWVLSFGAHAVVIEPESFRTEIAAELERWIKVYATQETSPHSGPPSNGKIEPSRRNRPNPL
jgi:predicted DNA-binding transcriptional regulator YafY